MTEFVVTTFADEEKAYQGVSAFEDMHRDRSITLFGTVVVAREANGSLVTKQRTYEPTVATRIGSLVGALVGLSGGPVGVAIGLVAGGAVAGLGGFVHGQVTDHFLEDIMKELEPGKFAVLAEVSEGWTVPIDVRMAALGGKVLRENREDVLDEKKLSHAGSVAQEALPPEGQHARVSHR